jgi:hypothetical protein
VLVSVSDNSELPEKHACLAQLAHARFRVFVQQPRVGMFRNFGILFQAAVRPYGILISDDDWCAPEYLLGADGLMEERPDIAAVMGIFVHLVPDKGAVVHGPINITAGEPAQRIGQYLTQNDGFNHPVYSVFRTAAVRSFAQYVEKHPLAVSFFDYLIVFSLLARGGLVSRKRGPYVYQNTSWSSPKRVRESNIGSYVQYGLPAWFADFHHLYRAVEGFRFLAGTLSPIEAPPARRAAGLVVLDHYLRRFKNQVSSAPSQWWERATQLGIRNSVRPFAGPGDMALASVLENFLALLAVASPSLHEQYVHFHEGIGST